MPLPTEYGDRLVSIDIAKFVIMSGDTEKVIAILFF